MRKRQRLRPREKFVLDQEYRERSSDIFESARRGQSLAARAWDVEKKWRSEKKLDLKLFRTVRGKKKGPRK